MARLTVTQLSEHTHVARAAIVRALRTGGLEPDSHHRYERDRAIAAIGSNIDPNAVLRKISNSQKIALPDSASELATARGEAIRLANRKLELAIAEKEKRLISVEAVREVGLDVVTRAKVHLLAVPARLAGELINEPDPLKIARAIDGEIRRALAILADLTTLADEAMS